MDSGKGNSRPRILVVSASAVVRAAYAASLQDIGEVVALVPDASAIKLLEEKAFEAVVLDWDGTSVVDDSFLSSLRAAKPGICILHVGSNESGLFQRNLSGVRKVERALMKTFSGTALCRVMRDMLCLVEGRSVSEAVGDSEERQSRMLPDGQPFWPGPQIEDIF